SGKCLLVTKDETKETEVQKILSSRAKSVGPTETTSSSSFQNGLVISTEADQLSIDESSWPSYDVVVIDDAGEELARRLLRLKENAPSALLWLKSSPSTRITRRSPGSATEIDRTLDRRIDGPFHYSLLVVPDKSPQTVKDISDILRGSAAIVVNASARKAIQDSADVHAYRDEPRSGEITKLKGVRYVVFAGLPIRTTTPDTDSSNDREDAVDVFSRWMGYATRIDEKGVSLPVAILVGSKPKADAFLKQLDEAHRVESRDVGENYKAVLSGDAKSTDARERVEHIEPTLLIVESPTKARTISGLFSRVSSQKVGPLTVQWTLIGSKLMQVVATQGHVLDLSLEGGFHGVLKKKDTFVPRYGFIKRCRRCSSQVVSKGVCNYCGSSDLSSKKETMDVLRELAESCGSVILATDPDSEGEKIAFDVMVYISPVTETIVRSEFHEVTRRGLDEALHSPRPVLPSFVQSQILRRVEDRWLGFELSRRLWDKFGNRRLSAGRAQSPILGWVVDRFRESRQKKNYIVVELESGLSVWLDVTGREDRRDIAKSIKETTADLKVLAEETVEVKPRPPYTTDSLLADSYSFLHIGPGSAMRLAQDLFETGLTTYHRTDSTRVSSYGIGIAKDYIEGRFPGEFRARSWGEQGAHEAIRTTRSLDAETLSEAVKKGDLKLSKSFTGYHEGLYGMIFRRFIASQMESAIVKTQRFEVNILDFKVELQRRVEIVKKGFTSIVPLRLDARVMSGSQKVKSTSLKTLPKVRLFTVGDLVSEMKRKGIGRPSTYAKLADTIMRRRYAFEVHGRIIATNLGMQVSDYLRTNFGKYVSDETTKMLGDKMQQVEDGKEDYQKMLSDLYEEVKSMPP
ncbi:MAG TPA: reverse gyrase, partial [Thermoproteota archaeon]|nr:reverse gyrase [Thermoproteota archaeon]